MDQDQSPVVDDAVSTAPEVPEAPEAPVEVPPDAKPEVNPEKEPSLKDKILDMKEKAEKPAADKKAEASLAPEAPKEPEAPKYEPNFKYKAFGKEKELDPFFRPLIKDAESEKKVKEVFTKADAFDDQKVKHEQLNTEYQQVAQQHAALDKDVRRITGFLNQGDMDNFFGALKISDEQLLAHLQKKAEIARMSPVQQQTYQDAVNLRASEYNRNEEINQMRETYQQQAVQYRTMQLDNAVMAPEISGLAQSWDARMGAGSFRQLVIEEGANLWRATNRDVPPHEVAQMVAQKYGRLLAQEQAPQMQAPQAPPQAPAQAPQAPPVVVQGKPVIPSVQGRGASPIKQSPKSLDDLKKMAARMRADDSEV